MVRFIVAHLRRRLGRSLALLVGVLVATTGFTVLTGASATSRLLVTDTVNANVRAAYDILVRPQGSRTALEEQRGVVRPNYLSGLYGGISLDQWRMVQAIPGVEVAAPVAMVGYATAVTEASLDLTDALDRSLPRQVLRLNPTWSAARGLSVLKDDTPQYVYVTRRPVAWHQTEPISGWSDGKTRPVDPSDICATAPRELQEDGRERPLCTVYAVGKEDTPLAESERARLHAVQWTADGRFYSGPVQGPAAERLTTDILWPILLLAAAVDPTAEAALVGLDAAVTTGRRLRADDRSVLTEGGPVRTFPVLTPSSPFLDERLDVSVTRLSDMRATAIAGRSWDESRPILGAAPGTAAGIRRHELSTEYGRTMTGDMGRHRFVLSPLVRSGSPTFAVGPDGVLAPQPVPFADEVYRNDRVITMGGIPWFVKDTGYRPLVRHDDAAANTREIPVAEPVGVFDPAKLRGFSELSAVPLETYYPPHAVGADDRSRQLLGGQPLEPDSNPAGYLATPPLLLMSLASMPGLVDSPVPLSAIRVRVADVRGYDPLTRERVRVIAERIASTTGLDVDVTLGTSPTPQTVALSAGAYGRPDLRLTEEWSAKGVAARIVRAIDRKSVVLFGLILVVCVLFLGNAVAAAVRDRRRELAVLACLGWPARRLCAAILGEAGLLGLLAGLLSLGSSLLLSRAASVHITAGRGMLAVPIACGLSLVAAAFPAIRAARSHPAAAVRPAVVAARRARRRRTIVGLAWTNLGRVAGRTVLAVTAMALAVCALTLLVSVQWAFQGAVVGSLLGDAVALRVRGVDAAAVGMTALLAALVVADVLYLNVRERAAELGALQATGWSDGALNRLVMYEGLGIGLLGAGVGVAAGLGAVAWFVGAVDAPIIGTGAVAALAGAALSGLAVLVATILRTRVHTTTLLAEE